MAHSSTWLALVLCLAANAVHIARSQGLRSGTIMPTRPSPKIAHFELEVTLVRGAPACGPMRAVILVNGLFQPTLYANVNDTIKITIINNLPASLPTTSSGISLHWHGFSMWNEAAWADGTAYVTQCPLAAGTNYTYSFLADESPGTYFWHDHSAMNRANGLQGVLILGMPVLDYEIPVPLVEDGEHVVFITDWFDMEANTMAMQLNRPSDVDKATNDTGMYVRIGNSDALLINGKGNGGDCNTTTLNGTSPICNVTALTVPAGHGGAGCTHETFVVESGKLYNFRLINGGTQQYVTVCFEKHKVYLLAADTTPMDTPMIDSGCVDINTGQRYDVLFEANQPPGLYWMSVHEQFQTGAKSTYAVIRYADANSSQPLPSTPTPQPAGVLPWDLDTESKIQTSDSILGYNDNYDYEYYWQLFQHRGGYGDGILYPAFTADKIVVFNMTQPLLGNGAIKWAMNNIAHSSNPPCAALMDKITADPSYLANHTAPNATDAQANATMAMLHVSTWNRTAEPTVYHGDRGSPVKPVAGMHVVELQKDQIVDVIINNLPSNAMNGDYRSNSSRGFTSAHPIHLHGHKFWVMGTGEGVFNRIRDMGKLNYRAPILRDTATLPRGGWLYLRFKADNPGLWPMHCHIMWHAYMGQSVVFAEAVNEIPKRPEPGPPCPGQCLNSFAPFTRSWVKENYKGNRFPLPS